jgi:acetyl-CoA C-acetyltransferase
MHSIASAVERLRRQRQDYALLTGLGWFATKHSAGVYSARAPAGEWTRTDPAADQAQVEAMKSPPTVDAADGEAAVETYTVVFGRDGEPELGIVIGRLTDGTRFVANTPADGELMWRMTREEFVGAAGRVRYDAATGRNTFEPG